MSNGWLQSLLVALKGLILAAGASTGASAEGAPPPSQPSGSGTIQELQKGDGPGWGTLSGLTAHPTDPSRLYAVTDADSSPLRIIEILLQPGAPPKVARQIPLQTSGLGDLDPEAIVAKPEGGFWLASEGSKHNEPPNRLLDVDASGQVTRTIDLPDEIAESMRKKGFEGIALVDTPEGRHLYVAFQTALKHEPDDLTRIGEVDLATGAWRFYYYPLDDAASGDLTGLSEIVHIGDRRFAVIERDGATGRDAYKRIMTFDLGQIRGATPVEQPQVLRKQQVLDLVPMFLNQGREVEPEVEGLAVAADGEVYAITDNDNERPTLLLRLGKAAHLFSR